MIRAKEAEKTKTLVKGGLGEDLRLIEVSALRLEVARLRARNVILEDRVTLLTKANADRQRRFRERKRARG